MTEIPEEYGEPGAPPDADPATGDQPTLDPVDDVLASLDGLDDLPVREHVAVFERAHEQLRAALTQG
jgi:hypothetical protein